MSKPALPKGYISMGELHYRVRQSCGDIYTRRWLTQLAAEGEIPGATPRPPSGKQRMFEETDDLWHWIQHPAVSMGVAKDQRKLMIPELLRQIQTWFRDQPPVAEWTPARRAYIKGRLTGVAQFHTELSNAL